MHVFYEYIIFKWLMFEIIQIYPNDNELAYL